MSEIISKRQLAARLGPLVSVSWIEAQCRARKIPHLLIGGHYGFTEEHVAEILAMHERRPEPAQPTPPAPPAPAPQRRTRAARTPQPTIPAGNAPLRDRGLPLHRLRRPAS